MARVRFSHNSFSVGIISEKVKGNYDFEGYNNALDLCENFQVQQTGGLFKRGGTHFVAETRNGEARLIMFVYSASDQYVLEFGENYIRFFTKDGVLYGQDSQPYELSTNISMAVARTMHTFQDGNQLVLITSQGMYVLIRASTTEFKLNSVQYTCEPMTFMNIHRIALQPDKTIGTQNEPLTLTVVNPEDPSQKPDSEFAPLFFDDDSGHEMCLVYKIENKFSGVVEDKYFYLRIVAVENDGQWKKVKAFIEREKCPADELPNTDPVVKFQIGAFNNSRGNPKAVAVFEGRLFLACNKSYPVGIWGSAKLYHDWSDFFLGTQETDGVQYKMSYKEIPEILWMIGQSKLFIGTSSGIFMCGSATYNDDAITPANFSCRMFSAVGASPLQPIAALDTVFFVDTSGRNVHEIYLNGESGAYEAHDISVLATDITQSGIIAHTWQQTPVKTYWCAVNDGFLCSLTYLKDMGIMAWTKHTISGKNVKVEDLCCMRGSKNDLLWMIVRREVNGVFKRYVEYMHPPYEPLDQEEFKQYYVDSGVNKEIKFKVKKVERGENPTVTFSTGGALPQELSNGSEFFSAIIQDYRQLLYIRPKINNKDYKIWRRIFYKERQVVDDKNKRKERLVISDMKLKLDINQTVSNGKKIFIKIGNISEIKIDPSLNWVSFICNNAADLFDNDEVVLSGFSAVRNLKEAKQNIVDESIYYKDIDNNVHLDYLSNSHVQSYTIRKRGNEIFLYYNGRNVRVELINPGGGDKNIVFNPEIYKRMDVVSSFSKGKYATIAIDGAEEFPSNEKKDVYINKIPGMTELIGQYKVGDKNQNTLVLYDIDENYLDAEFYSPYDDVNPNKGNMYLFFDEIKAEHLKGQEVCIMSNGNSAGTTIVPDNGVIKLARGTPYCSIGLRFKARFQTTSYSGGCLLGSSVGTIGGQNCFWVYVYYSLGGKYGSEKDKIFPIPYQKFIGKFDQPKSLITGLVTCPVNNAKDVYNRSIYIEHDEPLSFNILSITQDIEVSDA